MAQKVNKTKIDQLEKVVQVPVKPCLRICYLEDQQNHDLLVLPHNFHQEAGPRLEEIKIKMPIVQHNTVLHLLRASQGRGALTRQLLDVKPAPRSAEVNLVRLVLSSAMPIVLLRL